MYNKAGADLPASYTQACGMGDHYAGATVKLCPVPAILFALAACALRILLWQALDSSLPHICNTHLQHTCSAVWSQLLLKLLTTD